MAKVIVTFSPMRRARLFNVQVQANLVAYLHEWKDKHLHDVDDVSCVASNGPFNT